MFQIEKKILMWIEEHVYVIAFLAVSIIGGCIRISLRRHISSDAAVYLLPWYDIIMQKGQIRALSEQVGNYNLLYQFYIALTTYLPIEALTGYKLLSCIFDYLLALAVGCLVRNLAAEGKEWKFLASYSMVILSPIVFSNSATWAQCDSIYTFWLVLTLLFLIKGKYITAFICGGAAFAFKLQAIFFLPFLLFVYFWQKKFSILHFGIMPVIIWLSGIPAFIMGRSPLDVLTVYFEQMNVHSNSLAFNYPSFWLLLNKPAWDVGIYNLYKQAAILFAICILAAWMILWIRQKTEATAQNLLYIAFILTYTSVLFMPAMHERYGYVYEILAICILFLNRRTIPLLAALMCMTMFTYGDFLHGVSVNYNLAAIVNFCIYLGYCVLLSKQMSIPSDADVS